MFMAAIQTGVVIASIVGASFTAAVIIDDAPSDRTASTVMQTPRPWAVVETVAEILGVPRGRVVSTVRNGGTLATLAVEQGSSGDALAGALLDIVNGRIDGARIAGTIDGTRAAELRAVAAARIDALVFEPQRRFGRLGFGSDLRTDLVNAVEAELGLPAARSWCTSVPAGLW